MGLLRSASSLVRDVARRQQHFLRSQASASRPQHRDVTHSAPSKKHSYILQSPLSDVEIPNVSLPQYLFDRQEQFADRVAMEDMLSGTSYTHGQFRDMCWRLGSALTRLGIEKGDVLALVSPNCPEVPITMVGTASLGAVTTTINCTYSPDEIAQQLQNSGSAVVVTHPAIMQKVVQACELCPGVRHVVVTAGPVQAPLLSLQQLLQDDGTAFPHNVQIDPKEDVVVMPYSSGTTGLPKGVMLTHYNLVANLCQIMHQDINSLQDDGQDVFLGLLPYFHIYGMVPCLMLSFISGSKTVTVPTFDPQLFVQALEKHKITFLHTVPPIVNFMVQSPTVKPELLAPTHTMVCGAAPLGASLLHEFMNKFGRSINIQEGFGMTETSPVTHITPKGRLVPGSTGLALPNTETKIVDLDAGEPLGPNDGEGELCVRGPQVMKGYFNNDKATAETIDGEGWLHTGDIAKMDDTGNIYIVDRLKELIKVKGLQVAPAELEDLIRKHPEVADVAVIGLPDERAGEVPRAYVVLVPGSTLTHQAVEDFVAQEVAPHKRLAGGVLFTSAIPKSATGKILRRELKAQAVAQ